MDRRIKRLPGDHSLERGSASRSKPGNSRRTGTFQIAFVALILLAFAPLPGRAAGNLAKDADRYLSEQTKNGRFSGSALIARDGQVLFSKGYGFANVELEVPNTPQTVFRLGSVTKQFTAMAIMMLQERGKLNVQDPVSKYVPDCPEAWRAITIHHLLTHTAGIPNLTAFPDYRQTMSLPSPIVSTVARFKNRPLEFPPGEQMRYSNSGYVLLGYLVELVSGESYETFLRKNIFEPLKMTSSGYDHAEMILKNRAEGYTHRGMGMLDAALEKVSPGATGNLPQTAGLLNAPYMDMSIPHGAGALYSTVEDLLKWDQALYGEKLVPQKTIETIFTPFKNNYAYGWTVTEQWGHKEIGHGGQINGFTSFIARYPGDKVLVVVLCNDDRIMPRRVSLDLAALVFGEKIGSGGPRRGK